MWLEMSATSSHTHCISMLIIAQYGSHSEAGGDSHTKVTLFVAKIVYHLQYLSVNQLSR